MTHHTSYRNGSSRRLPWPQMLAVISVAGFMVAGCSSLGLKTHAEVLSENAESYIAAHPELSDATKKEIRLHRLQKGMSKEEVMAAWGRPAAIRKHDHDKTEYWYFGCDWPHQCNVPDDDQFFPMIDETYESQAKFVGGKLVHWRS